MAENVSENLISAKIGGRESNLKFEDEKELRI